MKRLLELGAAACVLVTVAAAQADDEPAGVRLEAGYQHAFVDGARLGPEEVGLRIPDHSYGMLLARGGYDVMPFLTLEAEAMVGIADTDLTIDSSLGEIPIEARVKYGVAAFGKLWHSPAEGLSVHARIGAFSITGETSALGSSETGTSDGLAYGIGGELAVADSIGLRLDLTQYRDGDDEFDAVAMTVVNRF